MRASLLLSLCIASICGASSPTALDELATLGRQLRHARSLPVGAPTGLSCPQQLDRFAGLQKRQIAASLGKPDYTPGPDSQWRKSGEWCYFFTSPVPEGQLGGGFPELTFIFDRHDHVVRTTCHYSR
jgi:hypothetical protein